MKSLRSALAFAAILLYAVGYGWSSGGHMVIADIAERKLRAEVRLEADRLLKIGATPQAYDFVSAAPWADDVRSARPETFNWHFINYHFRTDGLRVVNRPEEVNIVRTIEEQSLLLQDRSKPDPLRADALRFLIHFVGDLHQPLHASARDSTDYPKGDRGGNDFLIGVHPNFRRDERPPNNLHALWDRGAGLFPDVDRPLNQFARQLIDLQAVTLMAALPQESLRFDPAAVGRESFDIAKTIAYQADPNAVPSNDYIRLVQQVSARQATVAGYRLSSLLNRLLIL